MNLCLTPPAGIPYAAVRLSDQPRLHIEGGQLHLWLSNVFRRRLPAYPDLCPLSSSALGPFPRPKSNACTIVETATMQLAAGSWHATL
jgi:hypothetical protein